MPPAPPTKFARTSIEGWSRKRSASPNAKAFSAKKMIAQQQPPNQHPQSSSSADSPETPESAFETQPHKFVPRRSDDGHYYEDEYRDEHIQHMLAMETATLAQPELMDQQPELRWQMRPYLIDFIVEIHIQFRLRPEVLYLAVNIVDRYVSRRVVYKKHYQLVGCAALWIAAKFEDSKDRVPLVREFYDMCCRVYDQSAFIQMEGHILTTISWGTGHPTCESWLRSYLTHSDSSLNEDIRVQAAAHFLMELTLFHREFVGIRPSLIAWGSLVLARYICNKGRKSCPDFIACNESVAIRIAEAIDRILHDNFDNVSEILSRKYSIPYFHRCSTFVREFYLSGRRYAHYPEPPSTPFAPTLATPGLTPSSWSSKRTASINASPGGSFSCASSDAGDEPITPVTPVQAHLSVGSTDYVSAKENIAPTGHAAAAAAAALLAKDNSAMPPPSYTASRPVLHAIPSSLTIPQRAMHRLSN